MPTLAVLLMLMGVAVTRYVVQHWLGRRTPLLEEAAEKQDAPVQAEAEVEIVVKEKESVSERRSKLSLPDLSSIQIRSPVGPMKSSIRSALKELRSRQMVQSLCSKFEARLKVKEEDEEEDELIAKKPARQLRPLQPPQRQQKPEQTKTRSRDSVVAPVLLDAQLEGQAKRSATPTSMRSNNLNKFLRCYAPNADNAVFVEPAKIKCRAAVGSEQMAACAASHTAAESKIKTRAVVGSAKRTVRLELDLKPLALEFSNQNDSPAPGDSPEARPLLQAAACDVASDEHDADDNNTAATRAESDVAGGTPLLSVAFTSTEDDTEKESGDKLLAPEESRTEEPALETSAAPQRKTGIARFHQFQQQVPANALRSRVLQ